MHNNTISYDKPIIVPSDRISIPFAAGTLGSPGIVIIEPVSATINPAPADTLSSLTVMVNPVGAPSSVASSENEYWVFATQIGSLSYPSFVPYPLHRF